MCRGKPPWLFPEYVTPRPMDGVKGAGVYLTLPCCRSIGAYNALRAVPVKLSTRDPSENDQTALPDPACQLNRRRPARSPCRPS